MKKIKAWALIITKEGHYKYKVGDIAFMGSDDSYPFCIFKTKKGVLEEKMWTDEKAVRVEIKILTP